MRVRTVLCLNIASLFLALAGAVCAAYPVLVPFHGQKLVNLTVDAETLRETPAFKQWQETGDAAGRWGLFLVALGTASGAAAQVIEAMSRNKARR